MEPLDQRREKRQEVYHSIRIHIVSPEWARSGLPARYDGSIKNLSMEGMCIYFNEGYNPLNADDLLGKRIKIDINIPFEDTRVFLLGEVRWATREEGAGHIVTLGVQFVEMTDFHLKNIGKLLALDANDHNMLWDLWDNLRVNEYKEDM